MGEIGMAITLTKAMKVFDEGRQAYTNFVISCPYRLNISENSFPIILSGYNLNNLFEALEIKVKKPVL